MLSSSLSASRLWWGVLKAVRFPNLLILALSQYLVACCLAVADYRWLAMLLNPELLRLVSATVFIAAAGYLINDYYDVKIDYINKPQRVIVGKELRRREVMLAHGFLNFIGIVLSLTVSWRVALVCMASAFLLWLYSNQLKRLPLIGNLLVAFLAWMAIALVGLQFKGNIALITAYAGFAALVTLIRELIKDMEDIRGDQIFGCRTLPIMLGVAGTKLALLPLLVLLLIVLYLMGHEVAPQGLESVFYCLILLVLYGAFRLLRADSQRHFAQLSRFWKLLMLAGILSMLLF